MLRKKLRLSSLSMGDKVAYGSLIGHNNNKDCDCQRLETRWDQNGAVQPLCTGV